MKKAGQKRTLSSSKSETTRKKESSTVRERIIETAVRLFESQGYAATGINQIIAESNAAKASFYDHFLSKELLGKEYLIRYGKRHLTLIRSLIEHSETPKEFLSSWVKIIRRQLRMQKLYGCPMANLRAQIGSDSPLLAREVQKLTTETLAVLADFLLVQKAAANEKSARLMARRMFSAYEGAIHLWQLTGEAEALEDIEFLSLQILQTSEHN